MRRLLVSFLAVCSLAVLFCAGVQPSIDAPHLKIARAHAQIGPLAGYGPLPFSAPLVIGTPVSIGSANSSTASTSFTFTTTGNINSGDLLIVAVGNAGTAATNVTALTVGTNVLAMAQSGQGSGSFSGVNASVWYICGAAAAASGTTVTVTASGWTGTNYYLAAIHRVPGIKPSSCLDAAPAAVINNSNVTSCSVASGTLAQAIEYVLGFVFWNGIQTISEPGGFAVIGSTLQNSNGFTQDYAYENSSATTSITYNPTSASQKNMCMIATFK